MMKKTKLWDALNSEIVECRTCPRLVDWREKVAREKRRAFKEDDYWGKPVPGFGDPNAITWGQQLQKASESIKEAWWEGVFPGVFITLLVLGFSLLGNGLRDALDPRLRE